MVAKVPSTDHSGPNCGDHAIGRPRRRKKAGSMRGEGGKRSDILPNYLGHKEDIGANTVLGIIFFILKNRINHIACFENLSDLHFT